MKAEMLVLYTLYFEFGFISIPQLECNDADFAIESSVVRVIRSIERKTYNMHTMHILRKSVKEFINEYY